MARGPAADAADHEEDAERNDEQQDGERRRARRVATRDALEDIEGGDLRLEGQVARDQDHGAELADRARERERDTREKRGQEEREDDAPQDRQAARAE